MVDQLPGPHAPRVLTVAETGSTQRDVLAAAALDHGAWPHLSGLRAERQVKGRGRGDRSWESSGLTALTASVVLRPALPRSAWAWLPLLTGLAVTRAIGSHGGTTALKWPNDVLVPAGAEIAGWGPWRKVAGILAEVLGDGSGVVVGIGVNLAGTAPVPWASTLADAGVEVAAAPLLEEIRAGLDVLLGTERAGWPAAVGAVCATIGEQVRALLPGGGVLEGEAIGLAPSGGLLLRDQHGGRHVVLAGDIEHLRHVDHGGGGDAQAVLGPSG